MQRILTRACCCCGTSSRWRRRRATPALPRLAAAGGFATACCLAWATAGLGGMRDGARALGRRRGNWGVVQTKGTGRVRGESRGRPGLEEWTEIVWTSWPHCPVPGSGRRWADGEVWTGWCDGDVHQGDRRGWGRGLHRMNAVRGARKPDPHEGSRGRGRGGGRGWGRRGCGTFQPDPHEGSGGRGRGGWERMGQVYSI